MASLDHIQLPNKYLQKLKKFESKRYAIMRALKEPMPKIILHTTDVRFQKNYFLKDHLVESKGGIVVGKLFEVKSSRPQNYETCQDWLIFKGNCFLAALDVGICCCHQLTDNRQYVIKIMYYSHPQLSFLIEVKEIYKNPLLKDIEGEIKQYDYAFMRIQMKKKQKLIFKESLSDSRFAIFDQIEDLSFTFDAKIYQYWNTLPQELNLNHQIKDWSKNLLIETNGTANYISQELSYSNSTGDGSSGSPIVIKREGNYYIAGIHSRGSNFHNTNYGILFRKTFFEQLCQFRKINQKMGEQVQNTQGFFQKRVCSLKKFVDFDQNLRQLLMKTAIKQNPPKYLEFIGKVLKKIIEKFVMFQKADLIIQEISCEDIIISGQQENNFEVDFTRLKLNQFFNMTNKHQNFNCLLRLKDQIQALTHYQQYLPKRASSNIFQQILQEDVLEPNKMLLAIIEEVLIVALQMKQKQNPYEKSMIIAFVNSQVDYLKQDLYSLEGFILYRELKVNDKEQDQTFKLYNQITLQEDYNLYEQQMRQAFLLLLQYSKEKLTTFSITRIYLFKLSLIINQIKKVIQFFLDLYTDKENEENKKYNFERKNLHKHYQNVNSLSIFGQFPQYSLLFKDLKKYLNFADIDMKVKEIEEQYQNLFAGHNVNADKQILFSLATNELFFNEHYYHQLKVVVIKEITLEFYEQGYTLFRDYLKKNHDKGEQLVKNVLSEQESSIKKKKRAKKIAPFNIFETKIFKQLFVDNNAPISKLTQLKKEEQSDLKDIISILVYIRNSQRQIVGNGFFLNRTTVITVKQVFGQKLDLESLKEYQIVNKDQSIIGLIQNASFGKSKYDPRDLIFLDVTIYVESGTHREFESQTKSNILMINDELSFRNKNAESKYYALMVGIKQIQKQPKLFKSFGQIQVSNNNYHLLVGQNHLSGTPICLKLQIHNEKQEKVYQYAIIGVYVGIKQQNQSEFGAMAKFSQSQLQECKIDLHRFNIVNIRECVGMLKSTFKEYVSSIYLSFDHFFLRVLAQILRLNSLNIYLQNLGLKNIIMSRSNSRNVVFSEAKVNYLQESPNLSEEQFYNLRDKYENQNKKSFCSFIQQLLSNDSHIYFEKQDKFVGQSVIIKHLSHMKEQRTLKDYYLKHLEGKYTFDRKIYTLLPCKQQKRIAPPSVWQQDSQSLMERYLKIEPKQYLARLNACYKILKNTTIPHETFVQYNLIQKSIAKQFFSDIKKLKVIEESEPNKSGLYFFANRLIQQAISSLQPYFEIILQLSSTQAIMSQYETEAEIKDEKENKRRELKNLITHINDLYDIRVSVRRQLELGLLVSYEYDYQYIMNWTKMIEILDLHEAFN